MAKNIKLIKKEDFVVTEWSGGKTEEIYIYPVGAKYKSFDFKFRISSATVELQESKFTKLDGVYRFITPLDKKLKLTHNHKDFIELEPFKVYEFDGGLDTTSYGTARDFNLMLANGAKGSLVSIYIDGEYILNEELTPNDYTVIFTYDDSLTLEIDHMAYILSPMEALVISTNDNTNCRVKRISKHPTNVLVAKISI